MLSPDRAPWGIPHTALRVCLVPWADARFHRTFPSFCLDCETEEVSNNESPLQDDKWVQFRDGALEIKPRQSSKWVDMHGVPVQFVGKM